MSGGMMSGQGSNGGQGSMGQGVQGSKGQGVQGSMGRGMQGSMGQGMMSGGMGAGQMPDMSAMHAAMGKDGTCDPKLMQSMHEQTTR